MVIKMAADHLRKGKGMSNFVEISTNCCFKIYNLQLS